MWLRLLRLLTQQKKTKLIPSTETIIGLSLAALVIAGGTGYYFLSPTSDPPQTVVKVAAQENQFSVVDGCLDALLRAWSITDACYDKKNNTYFFNVAPHPHVDGYTDAGWYMLTNFTFIELDNGTWMLRESSQTGEVAPDVTNLRCKSQPANPDWYKEK